MRPVKNILVATDFTEIADHATTYAIELARQLGGKVTILHSYEIPAYGVLNAGVTGTADLAACISSAAADAMRALVTKKEASGVPVKGMICAGPPADEVHRVAEEIQADLIVVGTHGRRGLARALLGSVAEVVVRTSTRPVLAVHAPQAA